MKDMVEQWSKLRANAAYCARMKDVAMDHTQRELFGLLAQQLELLATEVERVITACKDRSRCN